MSTRMHRVVFLVLLCCSLAGAQSWQSAGDILGGTNPRAHATPVILNGNIYLLGGTPLDINGNAPVHVLNGTTWNATTSLEGAFLHHGAAMDNMGQTIIIAGAAPNGDAGDCYIWTVADGNNGGIQAPNNAPASLFAIATDDQNIVYSIGGGAGASPTTANPNVGVVEAYNGVTDTWTTLAPLPTPVADATACFDGQGHILVFGGYDASGVRIANVAQYDIATDTWSDTAVPDMPSPRSGARAVLGADGRVYVMGGSNGAPTATTFVLDVTNLTWSTGPAMNVARTHFGAILDTNGDIVVMGGTTTDTVERLFTPTCPIITRGPVTAQGFVNASVGFDVESDGTAPFTYQWYKDGVPLSNGPTPTGSVIVGAQESALGIQKVGFADMGSYSCEVSNACGSVMSAAATFTLQWPSPIPTNFTGVSIHPSGSLNSRANAVDDGMIGGTASYNHPQYGFLAHPILWDAATGTFSDITPASSVGGEVRDVKNGVLAGWWWWPYTVPFLGTGYYKHACVWQNAGSTHIDVQLSGWEIGSLEATDGVHHVGNLVFSDEYPTTYGSFYWPTTNNGPIRIDPPNHNSTSVSAIENGWEFGSTGGTYNTSHAARWQGATTAWVDMNPPGASRSRISGAGDGQQVGSARFNGIDVGGYWAMSGGSFTSLVPASGGTVTVTDCEAGLQVGSFQASVGGASSAALWQGTADSRVDLHQFLPADFTTSRVEGIDVAPDGTVTLVGYGYNNTAGRVEAVMWQGTIPLLSQDLSQISASAGGMFHQYVTGDPAWAGQVYAIVGSVSGTIPGIPLGNNQLLPLNFDFYMAYTLNNPNDWIVPSLGYLDVAGRATATGTLPAGALYVAGQVTLHHCVVILTADGQGYEAISQPVPLIITN